MQIVEMAESDVGGYKLASATVTGRGAYGLLKFESGIHRVQRVPVTESSGRVHTSAASVAVMPQAEEVRPRGPIPMACFQEPASSSLFCSASCILVSWLSPMIKPCHIVAFYLVQKPVA